MASSADRNIFLGKFVLFVLALVPFVLLGWETFNDQLGPNPVETLQRRTGIWTFNFLMLALSISPLRDISGLSWLVRFRRMIGLFAFFYGLLHLFSFVFFDHSLELAGILQDIRDRRFIAVGFLAWLLLLPLAATSSNWAIKLLGGRRWQVLQRLAYVVAVLGAVHYFWLSKGTALLWPIGYATVLAVLFGWRILKRARS
ncbi:protein-methionine-sulfoxide reductase heme-binding subunit MsrQ [uncultured Dechloromonas sp.]|uniref:sulfite oxidase heme-binding subunit YedZ n=1 Tax=uncultured Dechloromonas sp. TaxID=171719 RepID=UPI0025FE136A|nr:protein-methionine-sulfoxide reductase heme-binding subunit MsrQ [uncultured Dechloromonas sp.]